MAARRLAINKGQHIGGPAGIKMAKLVIGSLLHNH